MQKQSEEKDKVIEKLGKQQEEMREQSRGKDRAIEELGRQLKETREEMLKMIGDLRK